MHNCAIRTNDLCKSNHYAESVKPLVLLLSLTTTIYKSHSGCIARQHHLAAGVGHPARAPPRPPRLQGQLDSLGPDSEVPVLPVAAAPASRWHTGRSTYIAQTIIYSGIIVCTCIYLNHKYRHKPLYTVINRDIP